MSLQQTTRERQGLPGTPNSNIVFETMTEGWPGAGFEQQATEISARRVFHKDRVPCDETQISVTTTTFYEKSTRTVHGSVVLNAEQTEKFLAHLAKKG